MATTTVGAVSSVFETSRRLFTAELKDARSNCPPIANRPIDYVAESTKCDLQNTKEELEPTRNKLREANTDGSTLVDAMR
ncbi:UNVERIFIED_CONTAM: hypothetical protein HDU68_009333, partial [Siphonaria sp. JEL0065]